jgi:hypothetical protein
VKKSGRRLSNPSQVTPNSTVWVAINPGQRSTAMPMGRITEVITRNTKTMQKVRFRNGRCRTPRKKLLTEMIVKLAAKMMTPRIIAGIENSSAPQRKLGTEEMAQIENQRTVRRPIISRSTGGRLDRVERIGSGCSSCHIDQKTKNVPPWTRIPTIPEAITTRRNFSQDARSIQARRSFSPSLVRPHSGQIAEVSASSVSRW